MQDQVGHRLAGGGAHLGGREHQLQAQQLVHPIRIQVHEQRQAARRARPQRQLAVLEDLLQHLAREGTISESDLKLLLVTDSVEDALAHIRRHAVEQFGLSLNPLKLLHERTQGKPASAGAFSAGARTNPER